MSTKLEIKTFTVDGKHYASCSGLPDGSSYNGGPYDTEIEAENMCANMLQVLVKVFGDQIKNVEWKEQGEA